MIEIKYTAKIEEFEVTAEAHPTEIRPTYIIKRFKINWLGRKVYRSLVVMIKEVKDVNIYIKNMTGIDPELKANK